VDFLHRITSQDIKNLISGNGESGALLDPGGLILALFEIYNCGQFFLLVLDKSQGPRCLENLERLHFSEDIVIADVSGDFNFLSFQGKLLDRDALKKVFGKLPKSRGEIVGVEEALIAVKGDFSSQILGFHCFVKTQSFQEVTTKLKNAKFKFLSIDLWNLLRAESKHFSFGTDITEKNMILEGALVDFVARDKGCYPGQEVVERVFTYGTIAKKLMGLKLGAPGLETIGARLKLLKDGEDVGYVTSVHNIPWSGETFGFGIVRKPKYEAGEQLTVENSAITVEVMALPNSFEIGKNKPLV
jgi:folate-binding protein YgfZ